MYLWLALIGMLYTRSYYHPFDIDIFSFVEPLDFLLVVFSKTNIVVDILLGILIVLILVPVSLWLISSIINIIILVVSAVLLLPLYFFFFVILLITFLVVFIILLLLYFSLLIASRATWGTFRELLENIQGTFRELLENIQGTFRELLEGILNAIKVWFDIIKRLGDKIREKCQALFWRFFYVFVTVTLVFGTIYVPRHQGEQDAHDLRNSQQNEEDAPDSLIPWIDSHLSSIYPGLRSFPLTVMIFGEQDSQQKRPVRVTIRQDADQSTNRLPDSILFLGTTSSFHFFYEKCENSLKAETDSEAEPAPPSEPNQQTGATSEAGNVSDDENDKTAENGREEQVDQEQEEIQLESLYVVGRRKAPECKGGRPFVIPTANIASLEFVQNKKPHIDIDSATIQLDAIIYDLSPEKIEITNAIAQINQIITSINTKNREDNTDIEQINNLDLESFPYVDPDQIISVVTTFKSYLEDRKKITELNERIAIFNSTRGQNPCASSLEQIATIGSFPKGVHDRLEGTAEECPDQRERSAEEGANGSEEECLDRLATLDRPITPDQFVEKMNEHFTNRQTSQHLMLIGRVDSKPLTPEALQFYGSQINLARARAEWVHSELLKEFPTQIDPQQITLRTARPRCPDPNASNCARALDRTVEVWACRTAEESE